MLSERSTARTMLMPSVNTLTCLVPHWGLAMAAIIRQRAVYFNTGRSLAIRSMPDG